MEEEDNKIELSNNGIEEKVDQLNQMKIENKILLKRHQKNHSSEKTFHCKTCQKSFVSSSNLKRHEYSIHTGEKSHECKACGMKFNRQDEIARHEKIHIS